MNETEFNAFLKENIELIKQIAVFNPTISADDEWRTDDYSAYDAMV